MTSGRTSRRSWCGFCCSPDRATQLDTEAAEAYYRRALEFSEHDERAPAIALSKLAPVLGQRGDVDESRAAAETAIASLRVLDPHAAGVAMRYLATALWAQGESAKSRELEFEAISILELEPGSDLVSVYGSAAHRAALAGRFDDAAPLLEKGLALAADLGIEDIISLVEARAAVRGYAGDPGCIDDLRQGRDLGLRLGLGRATAVSTNNLADATAWFESLHPGRDLWDEGIAFARSRGLTYAEMSCRGERLRALYHLGSWEALERDADEVVRWVEEHGGGQLEVFAHVYLAEVLVHRGSLAEAGGHAAALLPRARESGDPQVLVPGLATAALVASAQMEVTTALERVFELESQTRGSGPTWRSLCLAWPLRIAAAAGELELSEAFLEGSEHASAWDGCARPAARATIAEARGRSDEAASLYREAAERWGQYGSVLERAYALLGLGRCGDAKALREGQAIFAGLGASPVVAQAA